MESTATAMPTPQEIRDQYLSNQLFLIGEKIGELEVIDRRANYIVVVDAQGVDKKMFLDEAYTIYTSAKELADRLSSEPQYAKPEGDLQAQLKKVYDEYPEYHEGGFDAMVKKFAGDNFYKLHHVAKAYLGAQNVQESVQKRTNFSTFSAGLSEGLFTYKGFRGKKITENNECALVFHGLVESCDDPWALLSAIRATEAFFEHRTAGTLERARTAVARVDDVSNHPWLHEDLGELPASENKSIFTIQQKFDLLDEDCDFSIAETLTYSGFKSILTEDFERDVHKHLSRLEKDSKLLDELVSNVKTIADIAHHYDKHSVHMKESVDLAEGKYGDSFKPAPYKRVEFPVTYTATAGVNELVDREEHRRSGIHFNPDNIVHKINHNAGGGQYSNSEWFHVAPKGDPKNGVFYERGMKKVTSEHTLGRLKAIMDQVHGGKFISEGVVEYLVEDAEEHAIKSAEKTKKISVRKLSSGTQLVKIAKRAAVELIAQKLAGKPVKKISKSEKNVILDAIKKKKHVVLKLAKKLVPKIKAIESEHHEHEHEGARGTDSRGEFGSAGA
jgi:hypothetical protein